MSTVTETYCLCGLSDSFIDYSISAKVSTLVISIVFFAALSVLIVALSVLIVVQSHFSVTLSVFFVISSVFFVISSVVERSVNRLFNITVHL